MLRCPSNKMFETFHILPQLSVNHYYIFISLQRAFLPNLMYLLCELCLVVAFEKN